MAFTSAATQVVARLFRLVLTSGKMVMELGAYLEFGITPIAAMRMVHDARHSELAWQHGDDDQQHVRLRSPAFDTPTSTVTFARYSQTASPVSVQALSQMQAQADNAYRAILTAIAQATTSRLVLLASDGAMIPVVALAQIEVDGPNGPGPHITLDADGGDIDLIAGNDAHIRIEPSGIIVIDATGGTGGGTAQVQDRMGRQFLRTDTGRTSDQLVQYRTETVAFTSGIGTVVFPEAFGNNSVTGVAMANDTTSTAISVLGVATTATAMTIRYGTFTGNRSIHWWAAGFKPLG